MMDHQLRTLLDELYQQGQINDARQEDRRQKMLNLEPETAQLISLLVRSSKRRRILEIGTSNGYSTCWLAWSAQQTGGQVSSIDREQHEHILADNALSHPEEIAGYVEAVRGLPDFEQMVIPVGKGLSVAYRAGT
jgi:predicted O-methyltransferase YrrM